jgi:hypothetical protein
MQPEESAGFLRSVSPFDGDGAAVDALIECDSPVSLTQSVGLVDDPDARLLDELVLGIATRLEESGVPGSAPQFHLHQIFELAVQGNATAGQGLSLAALSHLGGAVLTGQDVRSDVLYDGDSLSALPGGRRPERGELVYVPGSSRRNRKR